MGTTRSAHKWQHPYFVAVLDPAFEHGVFEFNFKTISGAHATNCGQSAAKHCSSRRKRGIIRRITANQVEWVANQGETTLLIQHTLAIDHSPRAQYQLIPVECNISKAPQLPSDRLGTKLLGNGYRIRLDFPISVIGADPDPQMIFDSEQNGLGLAGGLAANHFDDP